LIVRATPESADIKGYLDSGVISGDSRYSPLDKHRDV